MSQFTHAGGRERDSPADVVRFVPVGREERAEIFEQEGVFEGAALTDDCIFLFLSLIKFDGFNFACRTRPRKVLKIL